MTPYADICNTGKHRFGGASHAAAFLEHFVEKGVDWVHLDIAGPAISRQEKLPLNLHMTGFGS